MCQRCGRRLVRHFTAGGWYAPTCPAHGEVDAGVPSSLAGPSRLPEQLAAGSMELRKWTLADAPALAAAVADSLEHLRPWMPWANDATATAVAQRERLRAVIASFEAGTEWEYGMFDRVAGRVIGSCGLVRPKGALLEIGYWVHVAHTRRGHAADAVRALTSAAFTLDEVERLEIKVDEANRASAAVPRALGWRVDRTEPAAVNAPAETGRQLVWVLDR